MTPGKYDLGDYKEVAERIVDFRHKYPDGSLSSEVILWPTADLAFIAVRASAYRSKGDEHPGVGLAWEPFPGKTPYTRDSELQNAETSAWGRAIVAALASDTKQGIASADEIRARRSEPHSLPGDPTAKGSDDEGVGAVLPASAPSTSSARPARQAESSGTETEGEGEAPMVSVPATPEQRSRLLGVYKNKPSAVKAKAAELFGRPATVAITDLTAAEVEALILEVAS